MAEEILTRLQAFTETVMTQVEEDLRAEGFYHGSSSSQHQHSQGGGGSHPLHPHYNEEYHPDPERLFEYNYILGFLNLYLRLLFLTIFICMYVCMYV